MIEMYAKIENVLYKWVEMLWRYYTHNIPFIDRSIGTRRNVVRVANLIGSFEAAGRAQSVDISFVYKLIIKIILHISNTSIAKRSLRYLRYVIGYIYRQYTLYLTMGALLGRGGECKVMRVPTTIKKYHNLSFSPVVYASFISTPHKHVPTYHPYPTINQSNHSVSATSSASFTDTSTLFVTSNFPIS